MKASVPAIAVAYLAAALADIPLAVVTLGAGAMLGGAGLILTEGVGAELRRHFSPGVILLIPGLMILVGGSREAGGLDWLGSTLEWVASQPPALALVGAIALATVLANAMNNWPAALLLADGLVLVPGDTSALVVGTLIGATIGANLTPFGSLSTVFWRSLLARQGVVVESREYVARAAVPTLAGMLAAGLTALLFI